MDVRSVAILGPGLIGGSLVLALQGRKDVSVSVWARRQEAADRLGEEVLAARVTTDLAAAVAGAELIILATPMEAMAGLAAQLCGLRAESPVLVTDVGSAKRRIVGEMDELFSGSCYRFVGSHPMAGSEQAGFDAARADLFQDAACVVTADAQTDPEALSKIRGLWQSLGCRVVEMSPAEHDRRIALISHLPHVVASLLVETALGDDPGSIEVAGGGFRDSTRIAAGDPNLWLGILQQNRAEVVAGLEAFGEHLSEVLAILRGMDDEAVREFLGRSAELRKGFHPS